MRVLSRILSVWDDIAKPKTRKVFEEIVREIISVENPSYFNQGLMELGALILGPEDGRTIKFMFHLASIYLVQSKLAEAEQLRIKVVDVSKRSLGIDHLETIDSMAILAYTYVLQARLADSEALLVEVMEGCKRMEGLGSTNALRGISRLAWVYRNQDHLEKAIELQTFVAEESVRIRAYPGT